MRHGIAAAFILTMVSVCLPSGLLAQGAAIYDHSACTGARGGAAVAHPCADGSAVFYNPAALAVQSSVASAGATLVFLDATFRFFEGEGNGNGPANFVDQQIPVPHLYANWRPNDRLALGLGMWSPYGLGTEWPLSFEGRYVGYDNSLHTIYIQPTAAYQIIPGRVAVGAGLDVVYGGIEINRRLDADATPFNPFVDPGTDFADLHLEGNTWSVSGHVGLLLQFTERLSAGLRYLHGTELEFDDGSADFTQLTTDSVVPGGVLPGVPVPTPLDIILQPQFAAGAPLSDQTVMSTLELPSMFVAGISFLAHPQVRLLADYQWTGWSSFDRAVLDFEQQPDSMDTALLLGWEDTNTFRFGADYMPMPAMVVHAGYAHGDAAEPDNGVSPIIPEATRNTYSGGVGYQFNEVFGAEAAFIWVDQADRPGRVRPLEDLDADPQVVNVGVYESTGYELSLTLSYHFGGSR